MQNTLNITPPSNNVPEFAKSQDSLDIREFWRTLVRQRKMIFMTILGILLLALIFTLLSNPVYRATATAQIERSPNSPIDIDDLIRSGDIRDTRDFYDTQFALIQSNAVISRVIDKLNLTDDVIRQSLPSKLFGLFSSDSDANQKSLLVDAIQDNLTIEPIRNSRLVNIHFDASTPQYAANIANSILETFIEINLNQRFESTQYAERFLNSSITDARKKLDEAQDKLNAYALNNEILDFERDTSANDSLMTTIRRLSEELVKADSAAISIQASGGSNSELEAAKRKAELLRDELGKQKARALELQALRSSYRTLQREVETNRKQLDALLEKSKNIDVVGEVNTNNVIIVDKAQPPLKKHKPNLLTNMGFAALLGLFLATAAAFIRDYMDDSVKHVDDLERRTQLDVLGIIPSAKVRDPRKIAQLALSEPNSTLAEAFRSLRTTLRFKLRAQKGPNIVFITSARANEGKTTVAINLASTYAHSGNRVLLIDADLRNPSLHRLLGAKNNQGLTSYLFGQLAVEHLVQTGNVQNLDLIAAGETSHDPAELLSNRRMEELLNSAAKSYDIVVLDGPPILGLADSVILASLSSLTVMAINADTSSMTTIGNALKRLRQSGVSVDGLLLNKVRNPKDIGYENDYYHYPNRAA